MKRESDITATLIRLLKESDTENELKVETEREVTEDGYRADLAIETDDKVFIVEVKSGFGSVGELGPEVIPSGLAIKEAVRARFRKPAEVIFVSPGGASEYVIKGLEATSGSLLYGADEDSLSKLSKHITITAKASKARPMK
jgi:hypothetical protein